MYKEEFFYDNFDILKSILGGSNNIDINSEINNKSGNNITNNIHDNTFNNCIFTNGNSSQTQDNHSNQKPQKSHNTNFHFLCAALYVLIFVCLAIYTIFSPFSITIQLNIFIYFMSLLVLSFIGYCQFKSKFKSTLLLKALIYLCNIVVIITILIVSSTDTFHSLYNGDNAKNSIAFLSLTFICIPVPFTFSIIGEYIKNQHYKFWILFVLIAYILGTLFGLGIGISTNI